MTSFNTLLLPAIAAARLAQRARRRAEPASDLGRTPQGAVNGALERVLRSRGRAIRRGRDLPFGRVAAGGAAPGAADGIEVEPSRTPGWGESCTRRDTHSPDLP